MAKQLTDDKGFAGLTCTVPTLPSRTYFDPAHYQRELSAIWHCHWIYLCRSDSLGEPRSYRTFTIGNQRILLLRDDTGVQRAFHNVCRHRGSLLCIEREGRFKANSITCPYHQWTYGLEGKLRRTTSLAEAPDFDKEDFSLYGIALTEMRGCLFVSLAETPPPFDDITTRVGDDLSNWPMESLIVGHTWRKSIKCNWKVFWENFNECLHCPNVHPELSALVPIYKRRIITMYDDPNWAEHTDSENPEHCGGLRAGSETWSMDGRAQGGKFPNLTASERAAGQSYLGRPAVRLYRRACGPYAHCAPVAARA